MGDAIVIGSTSDYGKEFVELVSQNRKKNEHVLLVGKDEDALKSQIAALRRRFKGIIFNYKIIDMARRDADLILYRSVKESYLEPSEVIYCEELNENMRFFL